MADLYAAADIGATHARIGLFTDPTATKPVAHRTFRISRRYRDDLESLVQAVRELVAGKTLAGIAVAVAGSLTPDEQKVAGAGSLTDWVGKSVAVDLESQLGCRVRLINDAEASARGEALLQKDPVDFWHIIWGTGVGGSLVVGDTVTPGELGHQVLDPHDTLQPDGCGRPGCLESFTGGAAIERRYGRPAAKLTKAQWKDVCEAMAQGIYNVVLARPTSRVVFAGGIALNQPDKVKDVHAILKRRLKMVPAPQLSVTRHGEEAALVGALASLQS